MFKASDFLECQKLVTKDGLEIVGWMQFNDDSGHWIDLKKQNQSRTIWFIRHSNGKFDYNGLGLECLASK